jgi:hypothetical protein
VLPHPDHVPASSRELLIGVEVPLSVPLDLVGPVPVVCLMQPAPMLWATVPKTSVDEDCDLGPREYNVRRSTQRRFGAAVDQITETSSMQRSSQRDLRPSVRPRQRAHALAHAVRRCEWRTPAFNHSMRLWHRSYEATPRNTGGSFISPARWRKVPHDGGVT